MVHLKVLLLNRFWIKATITPKKYSLRGSFKITPQVLAVTLDKSIKPGLIDVNTLSCHLLQNTKKAGIAGFFITHLLLNW